MSNLEDGSLLQGLPSSQSPVQHQPEPTSAQLHLLAASVTNSTQTNPEVRTDEQTDESLGTEISTFENRVLYLKNLV